MRLLIMMLNFTLFCVLVVLSIVITIQFSLNMITINFLTLLVVLNIVMGLIISLSCINIGLKKTFTLLMYTGIYIMFNLGYYIMNLFTPNFGVIVYGYTSYTDYNSEAIGLAIMFLGMMTFYLSYMFIYKVKPIRKIILLRNNAGIVKDDKLARVRKWAKIIMYFGAPFAFIKAFLAIIQVQIYGYSSLYTNISGYSIVMLDIFDSFYKMGLICFLATNPPLKKIKSSVSIFFVYSILTLFYGVRGVFVINLLIIVWYLMKRDNLNIDFRKFMTKPRMFFYTLIGIIIMYAMKVFSQLRHTFGSEIGINTITLSEGTFGFIEGMGFSGRLVSLAVYHEDKLQGLNSGMAILYPILNYLQNNVVSRLLGFGFSDITSIEYLNRSYNFGAWLSYIFRPDSFYRGGGIGTNYLAESYIALGFLGVILMNVLLGVLLRKMDNFSLSNWKTNAVYFNIVSIILFIPRDTFFRIVPASITMLLTIFIISMIAKKK